MKIRYFIKLIFSITIIFIINIYAKKALMNYDSMDSTIQIQDSSLQKIWEIDAKSTTSTSLVLTDNKIYTTSDDGLINCYFIDGKEKWTAEVLGNVKNSAVLFKDLFLVATNEGDLYSINSNNGDIVQVIGVGETITTDLSLIDWTNNNSKSKAIIFGTDEGNIFCYDIFTFELIWKTNLSTHPLVSNPMLVDEKIVFKNSFESIYCVNVKSGTLIWKYNSDRKEEAKNRSVILNNGKTIYSIRQDGEIIAIDLMLGKKLWSAEFLDVIPKIAFSLDKQNLILLNNKGEMIFINAKDGKETIKIDLMKPDLSSFVITENDEYLFVGFSDGSLYSIDSKYNFNELISQTNIPITSIDVIDNNGLIVKDINGTITFYQTSKE